jgi:hypothetical protein
MIACWLVQPVIHFREVTFEVNLARNNVTLYSLVFSVRTVNSKATIWHFAHTLLFVPYKPHNKQPFSPHTVFTDFYF